MFYIVYKTKKSVIIVRAQVWTLHRFPVTPQHCDFISMLGSERGNEGNFMSWRLSIWIPLVHAFPWQPLSPTRMRFPGMESCQSPGLCDVVMLNVRMVAQHKMMSLINKSTDWPPPNYHKTARKSPKILTSRYLFMLATEYCVYHFSHLFFFQWNSRGCP